MSTLEQALGIEAEVAAIKAGPDVLDPGVEGVVDGNFSASDIITIAKQDVNLLAGLAMPTVFQHLFPPVLLAIWDLMCQSVLRVTQDPKLALGIPRGHGKTTIIKLFILYCILFTERKFILVMSTTATLAENIISDVIDMLEEPNIIKLFGHWKLGVEKDTQAVKKFGFRGRNIILAAIGAGGSVRGLNLKNERPDIMVFDDVQSKECAESQVQSDALERWMIGTAMKAKSPKGCVFIFAGNMFPGPNSILKKLKTNSNWIKFISGAILADNTVLWPELRSQESLIAELDNDIAMGHPEIFFSEVLNDTEAGINTNTNLGAIQPWPYTEHDRPQGKFILIDPATNKAHSDEVAIGYFEVYDQSPGLKKVIHERLSPGDTIAQALQLAFETNTRCIIIEANSYQYSLLYWCDFYVRQLGIEGMHFVDIYAGSFSKNSRISDMLKSLTANQLYLHDAVRNVVFNEIANWKPLKRDNVDNILDLLSYAQKAVEMYSYLMSTEMDMEAMQAAKARVHKGPRGCKII